MNLHMRGDALAFGKLRSASRSECRQALQSVRFLEIAGTPYSPAYAGCETPIVPWFWQRQNRRTLGRAPCSGSHKLQTVYVCAYDKEQDEADRHQNPEPRKQHRTRLRSPPSIPASGWRESRRWSEVILPSDAARTLRLPRRCTRASRRAQSRRHPHLPLGPVFQPPITPAVQHRRHAHGIRISISLLGIVPWNFSGGMPARVSL
jgi:hypothetical protein